MYKITFTPFMFHHSNVRSLQMLIRLLFHVGSRRFKKDLNIFTNVSSDLMIFGLKSFVALSYTEKIVSSQL